MTATLENKIEGILFAAGRSVTLRELMKLTGADKGELKDALDSLIQQFEENQRGTTILRQGRQIQMVTSPDVSPVVQHLFEEEFTGKLSRAALETLSIVAYRGPIPKPEVDQIRGVNSAIMLRTLMIRGLVERRQNPNDARSHVYEITPDYVRHLGVASLKDLPDYAELSTSAAVEAFLEAQKRQMEKEEAQGEQVESEAEKNTDQPESESTETEAKQ
ncbi:SMC-Scp complex subunit ScpB [Patescibacteria group bacterium]